LSLQFPVSLSLSEFAVFAFVLGVSRRRRAIEEGHRWGIPSPIFEASARMPR
jgi:hypothetical protein